MNREIGTFLLASWLIAVSGVAPALSAADTTGPQDAPVQATGHAAAPQAAVRAATLGVGEKGQDAAAPDDVPTPGKTPEPIAGAFGIPLGERFDPCMVAKVLSQEDKTYRGPDKEERKGILYRVEPKVTNTLLNTYAVATTAEGLIYSIRGDQEPAEPRPACEAPEALAAFLETKYGKPSETGPAGAWYSFSDRSRPASRVVRLHATRCGRGIYSIVYSDDEARRWRRRPSRSPSQSPAKPRVCDRRAQGRASPRPPPGSRSD